MTAPARTASVTPNDDGSSAGTDAARGLESLHRALQARGLYGKDHTAFNTSIDNAVAAFAAFAARAKRARLAVCDDGFQLGDDAPLEECAALSELAELLIRLDVAAIEIKKPPTPEHLRGLVGLLSEARQQRLFGVDLALEARTVTDGHVVFVPVSFSALRLRRGADDNEVDTERPSRFSWDQLVRTVRPEGRSDTTSPDELAGDVNRSFESGEVFDTHALHRDLRCAAMKSTGDGSERERLRTFVQGLSPGLRDSLLAIDRRRSNSWLSSISDLADVWPADELVTALEQVDSANLEISRPALLLLSRLAHVSLHDPDLNGRLSTLTRQWDEKGTDSVDETGRDMLDSLSELLGARERAQFNPEEYEQTLHALTERIETYARPVEQDDLLDPMQLRLHASAIAIELLADEDAPVSDPARLFGTVTDCLDAMFDRERTDLLLAAITAARRMQNDDEPEHRHAACEFLAQVASGDRFRRVLDAAMRDDAPSAIPELVRSLAPCALPTVIDLLLEDDSPRQQKALTSLMNQMEPLFVARAVVERSRENPEILKHFAGQIDRVSSDEAIGLLQSVFDDSNAALRHTAIEVLVRPGTQLPMKLLDRALRDTDAAVQLMALRRVLAETSDRRLKLVFGLLTGQLLQRPPTKEQTRTIIAALVRIGSEDELHCLAESLMILTGDVVAIREGHPAMIAESLKAHRDHAVCRRATRKWRLAPARLRAGRLFRAGRRLKGNA